MLSLSREFVVHGISDCDPRVRSRNRNGYDDQLIELTAHDDHRRCLPRRSGLRKQLWEDERFARPEAECVGKYDIVPPDQHQQFSTDVFAVTLEDRRD